MSSWVISNTDNKKYDAVKEKKQKQNHTVETGTHFQSNLKKKKHTSSKFNSVAGQHTSFTRHQFVKPKCASHRCFLPLGKINRAE